MNAWAVINEGIGQWSPDAMNGMSLSEFFDWYDAAVRRIEAKNEAIEEASRR